MDYDLVVLGAGVCGMQAAFRAVNRGKEVGLVEKERLGGTCLNRGCIPTKAMVRSAEVADLARRGDEFGVEIGEVEPDLGAIVERKDRIVDRVEETNQADVDATEELDLIEGTARFVDEHAIDVDGERYTAERFVIATGARPLVPDWPGVDEVDPLTSRELLDLTEHPDEMIVVGGGYIGIECAQMMARYDIDVTILQRSILLKEEDQELVDVLRKALETDGIEIREGTSVTAMEEAKRGRVLVHAEDEDGAEATFEADELLVAVGRLPNADTLDLEAAGVEARGPGWVNVDEHLQTNRDHIYAVGDAIGEHMFTHVGRDEAEVAIQHMYDDPEAAVDYHAAPYAIFADPELARVGYTLEEAREAGYDAEEVSYTYEHLGKAMCLGEEEGMMKCVADCETGELLGFHIVADHGAELLHEAVVQMHDRGTVDDLADAMHIHPTMAEGVNDTAYTMALELGRRTW
jgi:dihydrolipoamide dehydrogenase